MPAPTSVLFLNGSYGVGKSAVLDHLGDLLAAAGRPFSLMDVDWFHRSWPPAADDPDNVLIEAENLRAVWARYRRTGDRQPVAAGVIASPEDRQRYEDVFSLPVYSVRLEAGEAVREARLRRRYTAEQHRALAWHLDRHTALAERLAHHDLDESVVDTDHCSPHAVALSVLGHFDRS